MLVTLGHCNTSAMNVSVLHLVFEPARFIEERGLRFRIFTPRRASSMPKPERDAIRFTDLTTAGKSLHAPVHLRAIRRTRKIRKGLGAGFSFAESFPDKPPGMHWRTYLRMRAAAGESIW